MTATAVACLWVVKDTSPGSSVSFLSESCQSSIQRIRTLSLNSSTKRLQRWPIAIINVCQCKHQLLVGLELSVSVFRVTKAAFDLTEQGGANSRIF